MSSPYVVPFSPEHLQVIEMRSVDREDMAGIDIAKMADAYLNGPAFTVMVGNSVAACFGAIVFSGTGLIWCFSSAFFDQYFLTVSRLGKKLVDDLLDPNQYNCHRVEAYVYFKNIKSVRWVERSLNMQREGLMRQHGACGQDRYLYSVLRSDVWAQL